MILNKQSPFRTPQISDSSAKKQKPPGKRKIFRVAQSLSTQQIREPSQESKLKIRTNISVKAFKPVKIQPATSKSFVIKLAKFEKIHVNTTPAAKSSSQLSKSSNPIFNDSTKLTFDYSRRISKLEMACISRTGSIDGKPKPVNQDSLLSLKNLNGKSAYSLAAVFDGHGPEGHHVSKFVETTYAEYLKKRLQNEENLDYPQIFRQVIEETDSKLVSSSLEINYSGTTFLSVFINNEDYCCASIGDSRAILGSYDGYWSCKALNKEHKPAEQEERRRIEACGGRVGCMKDPNGRAVGPVRAWGPSANSPGLAMSRTIGDSFAKEFGVSSTPDITVGKFSPADKILIVATDGLWDVVKNQHALEVATKFWENGEVSSAAVALQSLAVKNAIKHGGYIDDISIVVVFRP